MEDLIETPNEESYSDDNAISVKLSSSVQDYYDKNIANKSKKVDKLAKQAVAAEIQVEEEKIRGRKSIIKSRISSFSNIALVVMVYENFLAVFFSISWQ